MKILDKEMYAKNLRKYYMDHYGEKDTDIWYEQPAVNVYVFRRGEQFITLKSHILTGEVEDFVENNKK